MPTSKPPYPAEFRDQMVELAQAGRSLKQLSREFGVVAPPPDLPRVFHGVHLTSLVDTILAAQRPLPSGVAIVKSG